MCDTPPDIDIQTDKAGAYAMEALLRECTLAPVAFSPTGNGVIRSNFGRFDVDGVIVEVIGSAEKKVDGVWEAPDDLKPLIRGRNYKGMRLPVLDLDYEADSYDKMQRPEKAAEIAAYAKALRG